MNIYAQKLTRFTRYCSSCACADACRAAFGDFWRDRSGGGVGCNKPFDGKVDAPLPPPAHRKGMTPDEVRALAADLFRPENLSLSLVLPREGAGTPESLLAAVRGG